MRVAQMIKKSRIRDGKWWWDVVVVVSAKFLENVSRESESRTWTWSVFRRDWNSKDAKFGSLGDL